MRVTAPLKLEKENFSCSPCLRWGELTGHVLYTDRLWASRLGFDSRLGLSLLWGSHLLPTPYSKTKLDSVAWVRRQTIPTERPPLVGEVSANFCGQWVSRGQRDGSLWLYSRFPRPEVHILKTPWRESSSEICRPSDRRLSEKLVPTFADRGCRVVSVTNSYGRILGFLGRKSIFSIIMIQYHYDS
jgi:hypothetical protein